MLLDRVSFSVTSGTLHVLIGPNGAGKTSLLRCILGQHSHTGTITLTWPGPRGLLRYVPQALEFDRSLPITVDDFIAVTSQRWPAFLGRRAATRATWNPVLASLGLEAKRRVPLGKLSGGELKRLMLAQALVPTPALLLLDEPTNHLDAPGVALTWSVLTALRQEGVTVLCTCHDLGQVRAHADAVTALAGGRVAFTGTPTEVLTPEATLALFASGAEARV